MEFTFLRLADRRTARQSIVVGVVVALLLLVAGGLFATLTKAQWTAESVSVVLPGTQLDETDSAAYYETLSRGQIVATFAEVASNKRFEQQAEQDLGLDSAQQASVTSEVTVAPSTSVVLIRVTSDDRAVSEQVAQEMTTVSQGYLQGLARPYRLEVVNDGAGTSFRSSTSPLVLLAAAVVVALVGGLAIQQALYHSLVALRSGARSPRSAAAPATPTEQTDQARPVDASSTADGQPDALPPADEPAPVVGASWWS